MRRTSRLLVVFGIGLAVLTFVLIITLLPGSSPNGQRPGATATPPVNVTVVVAASDVALGAQVTADMLTTKVLPANAARGDAFHDPSQAIGQIARRGILTGSQVGRADFDVNATSDTISVPAGKRALAISVNELTGVGNLVHPGDWVDVIVTLDAKAIPVVTVQPPNKSPYSHDPDLAPVTVKASALLQGIQVLGTIEAPAAAPAAGAAPTPAASQGPSFNGQATQKLVILGVTDAQAEAILFARYFNAEGTTDATAASATINLVLRGLADASAPPVATTGVDLQEMFNQYGVIPPYIQKAIDAYIAQQQP